MKKIKKIKRDKLNTKEVKLDDKPLRDWVEYIFDREHFIELHMYRTKIEPDLRSGNVILTKKRKPVKTSGSGVFSRTHGNR